MSTATYSRVVMHELYLIVLQEISWMVMKMKQKINEDTYTKGYYR